MIKVNTQPTKEKLPRIYSHKKFTKNSTISTQQKQQEQIAIRKETSQFRQIRTRLNSQRKTLKSANSSKTVHLQTTSANFHVKRQLLEKQNLILDKQIQTLQQQINQLRKTSVVKEDGVSNATSRMSQLNENKRIQSSNNKVELLRNKIDKQIQKNKKIMSQIDKSRRQITTIKKLNEQICEELNKQNIKYQNQNNKSKIIQQQLSSKNHQLHRKKIQSMHKKAQIIKDYDSILKKLDKDIKINEKNEDQKKNFYLTDLQHKFLKKTKSFELQLGNKQKIQNQTAFLKQKIKQLQQNADKLKQKLGVKSIQQINDKFMEQYQMNFNEYIYINQRHAHLQQIKNRNKQLLQRKQNLIIQLNKNQWKKSDEQIQKINHNINSVKQKKIQINKQLNNLNQQFQFYSKFIINFHKSISLKSLQTKLKQRNTQNIEECVNQLNMKQFFQQILQIKQKTQINNNIQYEDDHMKHMLSSGKNQSCLSNLEQQLQNIRKENNNQNHLLQRQQFLKTKDNLNKKKLSARNKPKI